MEDDLLYLSQLIVDVNHIYKTPLEQHLDLCLIE